MKSVFIDKDARPAPEDLKKALGNTIKYWTDLVQYVLKMHPDAIEEWNYSGEKFGWSFRLKDKKRVILYLLPREKYFKAALVFGQKAADAILKSDVSDVIKSELREAKVNAEGRGIRIPVNDGKLINDIKKLVLIKLSG